MAPMKVKDVWLKLIAHKPASRSLNYQEFKHIRQKTDNPRIELIHAQKEIAQHPINDMINFEK